MTKYLLGTLIIFTIIMYACNPINPTKTCVDAAHQTTNSDLPTCK